MRGLKLGWVRGRAEAELGQKVLKPGWVRGAGNRLGLGG